jgi:CrcB protein
VAVTASPDHPRGPYRPHPIRPRPGYLRPERLALVAAGGVLGTAARAALGLAFPQAPGAFPWTTGAINLIGAGLLGLVLGLVGRLRASSVWAPRVRLALGTGLLGGFTTYSTFAVETVRLTESGRPWLGLAYALGSLAAGICLAALALTLTRPRGGQR